MALYQLYQKEWEISVRQSNRGVDILRQTLEDFKLHKSPAPPPHNNNLPPTGDWYESSVFSPYSNTVYSTCSDPCCSGGVSPSESPPGSCYDSLPGSYEEPSYFPYENQFYPPEYQQPPQLQFVQIQAPPPPPPVALPVLHYPPLGSVLLPHYTSQPRYFV